MLMSAGCAAFIEIRTLLVRREAAEEPVSDLSEESNEISIFGKLSVDAERGKMFVIHHDFTHLAFTGSGERNRAPSLFDIQKLNGLYLITGYNGGKRFFGTDVGALVNAGAYSDLILNILGLAGTIVFELEKHPEKGRFGNIR